MIAGRLQSAGCGPTAELVSTGMQCGCKARVASAAVGWARSNTHAKLGQEHEQHRHSMQKQLRQPQLLSLLQTLCFLDPAPGEQCILSGCWQADLPTPVSACTIGVKQPQLCHSVPRMSYLTRSHNSQPYWLLWLQGAGTAVSSEHACPILSGRCAAVSRCVPGLWFTEQGQQPPKPTPHTLNLVIAAWATP